ncbi:MAG TPA: Hsp20/alpha crystallin family protein [Vicinamibacterales bacterium]|nr:Hsp20/alpha crystallin family protein [Vicinamibacterales bacterium]
MADTRRDTVQDLSQQPGRPRQMSSRRGQSGRMDRNDESMMNPFQVFRRINDEMDRWFDRAINGGYQSQQGDSMQSLQQQYNRPGMWSPRIEAFQRGDEFIVRAELPGLKKEDVRVNITEDSIVIEGERRDEFENTHGDVYHSERSYGSFYREIPLPEGAISDNANATFRNGVLEVKLQAPPREVRRGRSVDINEG